MEKAELISRLKSSFSYDPESGSLFRLDATKGYRSGRAVGAKGERKYLRLTAFGVRMYLHQAIWAIQTGEWPDTIDHIDGDPSNNRWANLRACTQAENIRNKRKHASGASPYKGAYKDISTGRWKSSICIDRRTIHLGMFATPEEAHAAYATAARRFHGEFARLS